MWDVFIAGFSYTVSIAVVILQYLLVVFGYFLNKYPEATTYGFLLVSIYIAYRLLVRLVKVWVNFLKTLIKLSAFLFLVGLIAILSVRGSKFFTRDLLYVRQAVYSILNEDGSLKLHFDVTDYFDSAMGFLFKVAQNGNHYGKLSINTNEDPYVLASHLASEGFKYVQQNKEVVADYVSLNLENWDVSINNQNLDMDDVKLYLKGSLNALGF